MPTLIAIMIFVIALVLFVEGVIIFYLFYRLIRLSVWAKQFRDWADRVYRLLSAGGDPDGSEPPPDVPGWP